MLKPPMPTSHRNEELVEYFPHIVFVQNKSFYSDFSIDNIKTVQVRIHIYKGKMLFKNKNCFISSMFMLSCLHDHGFIFKVELVLQMAMLLVN